MNLRDELLLQRVENLDLSRSCRVDSHTTLSDTVFQMRKAGVNVCLITEEERLVGILTDRDVLRKVAIAPEVWPEPVKMVMTRDPITISPDATAAEALWLMDEKHFRNLPAVDSAGRIVGLMTHQAVIDYLAARYPVEILNLPPRPGQIPDRAEGG